MIPKILHLTWKNSEIPQKWAGVIDKWKELHPGWKIHFTTDEDNREYIQKNHPDFLETYDSYKWGIQRADAIRYFYLRDMGGVYADLDIEPLKPIDEYLNGINIDALLVYSGNVKCFTNSFMASPKGSPFWDEVIDALKNPQVPWWAKSKWAAVMYSTGPIMLDRVAKSYLRPIGILPQSVFMAYSLNDHGTIKPDAALKPLEGGSWHSWDAKVLNFLFKWKWILLLFFFFGICALVHGRISKISGPE